jgi:hypothetical protein
MDNETMKLISEEVAKWKLEREADEATEGLQTAAKYASEQQATTLHGLIQDLIKRYGR